MFRTNKHTNSYFINIDNTGSYLMIELMYGAMISLFLEKSLCSKAFLHDKLNTFLFDNIRNDNEKQIT